MADFPEIVYKITKGPKHKIATVSIDGNKVLGDKQLMAHVSVQKAKLFSRGTFSEKLLRASTKNLYLLINCAQSPL